jgi:uncharacterized protein YceH (UPF0502 family)
LGEFLGVRIARYSLDCAASFFSIFQVLVTEMGENQTSEAESGPKWQVLERVDRRVVGVLVEKAKTTPESYPLSLNALVNGCNQKSNRFPQMQLDEGHVDEALERLRALGASAEIQGDGRVDKYRHLMYDWLGVDKFELAVMTELLLRGAQTLGELRGRAARMEPIKGVSELRPIVESLRQKGLLILLTPPGRGCAVTHNLYQPQELEKVRGEFGNVEVGEGESLGSAVAEATTPRVVRESRSVAEPTSSGEVESLRVELQELKAEFAEYRANADTKLEELRSDLDELNRQLGV